MTGFGRAVKTAQGITLEAQMTSVNKRGQEISINVPRELAGLEPELHETVRTGWERGKLQLNVTLKTSGAPLQMKELKKRWSELKKICKELGAEMDADAELVWDVMRATTAPAVAERQLRQLATAATQLAMAACQRMQKAEGLRLAKDFAKRLSRLAKLRQKAAQLARESLAHQRTRLMKNLEAAGLTIDAKDERVLKELALWADRVDVSEELTRIEAHLQAAQKLLKQEGGVGRPLEFLLQELQREWNTLGNKAAQVDLVQVALDAKNEVERLREQAANIA